MLGGLSGLTIRLTLFVMTDPTAGARAVKSNVAFQFACSVYSQSELSTYSGIFSYSGYFSLLSDFTTNNFMNWPPVQ